MSYKKPLLLIIIISLTSFHAKGQFLENEGFPFIRNYTPEEYDGFVQNWGFTQDSMGQLYVANTAEVLHFNGVSWSGIGITKGRSYSIAISPKDTLYVGGRNEFGYLAPSQNDNSSSLQYYSLRKFLPDSINFGVVWDIVVSDEMIYFNAQNYLFRFNSNTKEIFFWEPELRFQKLFLAKNRVLVRASNRGLLRVEGENLLLHEGGEFFREISLSSYISIDGKEIFCSIAQCYIKDDVTYKDLYLEPGKYLKDNYIDEVITLDNGTLLFATRTGGIVNVDANGNLVHILNEVNGLISNTVYGLYEDNTGAVWVATRNGISKVDYGLPLRVFDSRNDINDYIFRLKEFEGRFYGATSSSGVLVYDTLENRFRSIDTQANCKQLFEKSDLLYAVCGGFLYLLEGESAILLTDGSITLSAISSYENSDTVFLGNNLFQVLAELKDKEINILYQFDDIKLDFNSLEIDKENNIWIGSTAGGLFRVQIQKEKNEFIGHKISSYLKEVQNASDNKRIFVTNLNGEPVFLTWGAGIQRYDSKNDKLEHVTRYGDFFSDSTRQFFWAIEDINGNVWFRSGSEYQGAILERDGSYQVLEGVLKRISDGQNHTIYPDSFGNVWYSVGETLIKYASENKYDYSNSYSTNIVEVKVRNDSLINGGIPKRNILEYKDNELRFTYAAASYDAPEKTQYRVKLEGFDENWTRWTNETQKDYTNIPEGDYKFVVQAKNVYGTLSTSELFAFSVLPPWYRTWWAYVLYLILVTAVFYSIYKVRINQLLKVERMRTKIASDLHDEVSATLTGISYFAQALRKEENPFKREHFISLIVESSEDAKEKITDIVWSINPDNDNWGMFLSKCRRYASDLLESKEIKYELRIVEWITGNLSMEIRQHLWMIYKEMLTNAVRHSNASRLDVIMDVDGRYLKLIVQDDGEGFDSQDQSAGNGVSNIRRRAEVINATLEIDSESGFGTRWRLVLPL